MAGLELLELRWNCGGRGTGCYLAVEQIDTTRQRQPAGPQGVSGTRDVM